MIFQRGWLKPPTSSGFVTSDRPQQLSGWISGPMVWALFEETTSWVSDTKTLQQGPGVAAKTNAKNMGSLAIKELETWSFMIS